jgi:hypothetical protein
MKYETEKRNTFRSQFGSIDGMIFAFFAWLLVILIGQFFGLYLFIDGFFPDRAVVPRRESPSSSNASSSFDFPPLYRSLDDVDGLPTEGSAPVPRFGKLVFVVIDALRSSFLFGNDTHMHFTRHLIESGQAIGYVAHAAPPTVTLPRIKVTRTPRIDRYRSRFVVQEETY